MRRQGMMVVALAALLVFAQVGTAAADETRGTASTDLLGVAVDVDAGSLTVTGLTGSASVDVLDVGTYASIDGTERTSHDGPFAEAAVVPLRVGDDEVGAVRADTADGAESGNSGGGVFGDVNDALAALGVSVAPVSIDATASAQQASAMVDTLLADVAALLQAVDLDVNVSELSSLVDQSNAASGASIDVSSLDVTLGDLLPLDVLETLPLSAILDLLDALPIDVGDVDQQVQALRDAIADVEDQLGEIEAAGAALDDAAGPHADLIDAIDDLIGQVEALGDPLDAIGALPDILDEAADLGIALPASCDLLDPLTVLDCVDDLETALASARDDALDDAATDLLGPAQDLADAVAAIEALLDAVTAAAGDLEATLSTLLDDLLAEAAATELFSVDGFVVGLSAVSTGDVDTSDAVVGCSPVTASVLGTAHTLPACSEGLSAVQDVAATVGDAIGSVQEILAGLPFLEGVGTLRLELFGGLHESVVEDGDYVVATAGVELLDLDIPSFTLDPSDLGGLGLGDLALPDVVGTVQTVIDDAQAAVAGVLGTDPVGDDIDAALAEAEALLGDGTGALDGAVDAATAALDSLLASLGDVGTFTGTFTTPSLRLVIDPTSTAEFALGSAPAPPPDDDDDPPLPTTGGGLALFGLLALGAALSVRRRR